MDGAAAAAAGGFSLAQFDSAISAFQNLNSTQADRDAAQAYLANLLENPASWMFVQQILQQSSSHYGKVFGIQILEKTIQHRWGILSLKDKTGICNNVTSTLIELCSDSAHYYNNLSYIKRFQDLTTAILINTYPGEWPDFIDSAISVKSEPLAISMMEIIKQLAEETFEFSRGIHSNIVSYRGVEIKKGLTNDLKKIIDFAMTCLANASVQITADAALNLLSVFVGNIGDGFSGDNQSRLCTFELFSIIFNNIRQGKSIEASLELLYRLIKRSDLSRLQKYGSSPTSRTVYPEPNLLAYLDDENKPNNNAYSNNMMLLLHDIICSICNNNLYKIYPAIINRIISVLFSVDYSNGSQSRNGIKGHLGNNETGFGRTPILRLAERCIFNKDKNNVESCNSDLLLKQQILALTGLNVGVGNSKQSFTNIPQNTLVAESIAELNENVKNNEVIKIISMGIQVLLFYFDNEDNIIHRLALKTLKFFLKHVCDLVSSSPREALIKIDGAASLGTGECSYIGSVYSQLLKPAVRIAMFKMPKPSEVLIKSTNVVNVRNQGSPGNFMNGQQESPSTTTNIVYDRLTNVDSIAHYEEMVVLLNLLTQTNREDVKTELKNISNTIVTQLQNRNQLIVINNINALSWSLSCIKCLGQKDLKDLLTTMLPLMIQQLDFIQPCYYNSTKLVLASSIIYIISSQYNFVNSSVPLLKAVIQKLFKFNNEYEHSSVGLFIMSTNSLKNLFKRCYKNIDSNNKKGEIFTIEDVFGVVLRGGVEIMEGVGYLDMDIKYFINVISRANVPKIIECLKTGTQQIGNFDVMSEVSRIRCVLEGLHYYYKHGVKYLDDTLGICWDLYKNLANSIAIGIINKTISQNEIIRCSSVIDTLCCKSLLVITSCINKQNISFEMLDTIGKYYLTSELFRRPEVIDLLTAVVAACLATSQITHNKIGAINSARNNNSSPISGMNPSIASQTLITSENVMTVVERLYTNFVSPQLMMNNEVTRDIEMKEHCFLFLEESCIAMEEVSKLIKSGYNNVKGPDMKLISQICENLLFGLQHQAPKIVDLSLRSLSILINMLYNLDVSVLFMFLTVYFERILSQVLHILLDTFHVENMQNTVKLVFNIVSLVCDPRTMSPGPINPNFQNNRQFVRSIFENTIHIACPNLSPQLIQQFIDGALSCNKVDVLETYFEDILKLAKRRML